MLSPECSLADSHHRPVCLETGLGDINGEVRAGTRSQHAPPLPSFSFAISLCCNSGGPEHLSTMRHFAGAGYLPLFGDSAACERESDAVSSLKERLGGSITLRTRGIGREPEMRPCDPIRSAEIQGAVINQDTWRELQALRYVDSLTIINCRFAPGTKVSFAPFSYLWTLTVRDSRLSVDDVSSLARLSRLRYLYLIGTDATSEWLPWIGQLHELEGLEVHGIATYSQDDIRCLGCVDARS